MKILVVVDMQNDFITGALGTKEAQAIVPKIQQKIDQCRKEDNLVVFTQDTHDENYLNTQEGKHLPIPHCIQGSDGWQIVYDAHGDLVHKKSTFGSEGLVKTIRNFFHYFSLDRNNSIELVGVCTGICVLSNAVLMKSMLPEIPIVVDASCCACVTPESHKTALEAMKLLQIEVINE